MNEPRIGPAEQTLMTAGGMASAVAAPSPAAAPELLCEQCWAAFAWESSACPQCGASRPLEGWGRVPYRLFRRFELKEPIARSAASVVFRGVDIGTGKTWALKLPVRAGRDDAQVRRWLQKEHVASGLLSGMSDYLLPVVDCNGERAIPYVQMEPTDWPTLRTVLASSESGRLNHGDVVLLGLGLLEAVGALHERGLVHRGLESAALFVKRIEQDGGRWCVKIADLGSWSLDRYAPRAEADGRQKVDAALAGVHPTPGQTATAGMRLPVAGRPDYMSPEQIRCEDLSVRSDVHAIGSILWEAATGAVPYPVQQGGRIDMTTAFARKLESMRTPPPPDGGMPQPLYSILTRALSFDPNARWASARDMRTALSALVRDARPEIPVLGGEVGKRIEGVAGRLRERAEQAQSTAAKLRDIEQRCIDIAQRTQSEPGVLVERELARCELDADTVWTELHAAAGMRPKGTPEKRPPSSTRLAVLLGLGIGGAVLGLSFGIGVGAILFSGGEGEAKAAVAKETKEKDGAKNDDQARQVVAAAASDKALRDETPPPADDVAKGTTKEPTTTQLPKVPQPAVVKPAVAVKPAPPPKSVSRSAPPAKRRAPKVAVVDEDELPTAPREARTAMTPTYLPADAGRRVNAIAAGCARQHGSPGGGGTVEFDVAPDGRALSPRVSGPLAAAGVMSCIKQELTKTNFGRPPTGSAHFRGPVSFAAR